MRLISAALPEKSPFLTDVPRLEDCDGIDELKDFTTINRLLGQNKVHRCRVCNRGADSISYKLPTSGGEGRSPRELSPPYAFALETKLANYLVDADIEPETLALIAFEIGRGIGDCATSRKRAWKVRGFVLVPRGLMPECLSVPNEPSRTLLHGAVEQAPR